MLFIVATPIGNLDDISKRALEILQNSDAILCEDTRRSSILLNAYGIRKKLISYHKFKEKRSLQKILQELESGKTFALISDAGTPCIQDPGQILVEACREKGIEVSSAPGPCSIINALVLSGFPTNRFQFVGFLPKRPQKLLQEMLTFPGTSIAFVPPQKLVSALSLIPPERRIAVIKEMSKKFEECRCGSAKQLLEDFQKKRLLGEVVLLIEEAEISVDLSAEELIEMLMQYHGYSLKEAIKKAARFKQLPKNEIYKKFHSVSKIGKKRGSL